MRVIIKVEHVEEFTDKAGKKRWRTHALLDDGTEAIGYGKEFDLEDKVEVFYDDKWNTVKMRRGRHET